MDGWLMLMPPAGGSIRVNDAGGNQSSAIASQAASIGRGSIGRM